MRDLRDLLGVELPIIQAPMAGVQDSKLPIAVAQGGGLGPVPTAMLAPPELYGAMRSLQGMSRLSLNLNFFCHNPPAPDPQREVRWREALAPYYEEFEIDPATIADGPIRAPFTETIA